MQSKKSNRSKSLSYFGLLFTGGGIGWLVGLSISPVVSIVITSVTGSAAAIIAAMSGIAQLESDKKDVDIQKAGWNINPLPLSILVIGLVAGTILGILVRNNSLFGSDISIEVQKWSQAGLIQAGISEHDIVHRIFESQYPSPNQSVSSDSRNIPEGGTVLFMVSTEQCDSFYKASARSDEELINALNRIKQFESLSGIVDEPKILRQIVEEVICQ